MPSLRVWLAATGTALALSGAAAMVVTGWSPVQLDAPSVSTVVTPETVTRNLNCSGSPLASVADSTTWSRLGAVKVGVAGGEKTGQFTTDGEPDGAIVTYSDAPDRVAATESAAVVGEVLAGYLAAECADPTNSQWLVGGSTATGRDAVLTIANGSAVDARVDLEFWGAAGRVSAPAASGLVIPAGSVKSFSLAGFVPDENSPVVHVVSNGAAVWSTLQVSTVRGLQPGGLDRIVAASEPSTHVVVPVVRQPDEELVGPLRVDPDYTDTITTVRLLAPGELDGTARLTVTPVSGDEPVVIETPIVAGEVLDIPIDELAVGDFSLTVDADVPVVASARFSTYNSATRIVDMAWAPAITPRTGTAMAYVPVANSALVVANPTDTAATITVTAGGATTELSVPARSAQSLIVGRGPVVITSDVAVAPGVVVTVPEGIATLRLPIEPLGARSVTVISH